MSSKISLLAFIVLIGVLNVNSSSPSAAFYIQQRAENALMEQMMLSRSLPMQRASIADCHPHYSEILKNLLETYESDLQNCKRIEEEQLTGLENEGQESRVATTGILEGVCNTFEVCKGKEDNLDFFDCVNQSGDESTRNVWKASKDSSDTAAHIREQRHVIEYETGRCNSEAERKYIVGTAKTTDEMLACYANGGIIPTEAPVTPAPETPAPETPAPETPAPETPAPETPAPETPAPETPEPETPAPETPAPETPAPETPAPETPAPETPAPETPAPETPAPETPAPETPEPETPAPETPAPETPAPETPAPETPAPETPEPETPAPENPEPENPEPETSAPVSDEMDQVEELEDYKPRAKLDKFMKNLFNRF